jgi:hypothetical protein
MTPDQIDKAIKRSSMDEPPYEGKPSAKRLTGESKQAFLDQVETFFTIEPNYDIANVVDLPGFDECFNYTLINYYYTKDTDPSTVIDSYRVWSDGKVTQT